MKIAEYSEVLLKDGRSACIVEVLSDTDFLADVGNSPEDWENIYIKKFLKTEIYYGNI